MPLGIGGLTFDAVGEPATALEKQAIRAGKLDSALGQLERRHAGGREAVRRAVAGILLNVPGRQALRRSRHGAPSLGASRRPRPGTHPTRGHDGGRLRRAPGTGPWEKGWATLDAKAAYSCGGSWRWRSQATLKRARKPPAVSGACRRHRELPSGAGRCTKPPPGSRRRAYRRLCGG